MISAMIQTLSEAFVYAAGQGVAPGTFFEAVNSALFQSPYCAAYAKLMLDPPQQPGATMELGEKDLRLMREAAGSRGTELVLADLLAKVFAEARTSGLAREDWVTGLYRMSQKRGGVHG